MANPSDTQGIDLAAIAERSRSVALSITDTTFNDAVLDRLALIAHVARLESELSRLRSGMVDGKGAVGEEGGLVIDSLGGNCPVQADGTFDGAPFYFRARGSGVTCEAGDVANEWCWEGPRYDWPDAGWISEEQARLYIETAYAEWKRGDYMERLATKRARNAERDAILRAPHPPSASVEETTP